jgi:hypothetical protein
MVEREEFEAMKQEIEECKSGVHNDIKELKDGHRGLQEALHAQSVERKSFNDEMKSMIANVMSQVKEHTIDEMDTIKKIHTVLDTLVKQTADNTGFISSVKQNEELERRLAERMDSINRPKEEMWKKVKLTVITTLTIGFIGAIGTGIGIIVKMYFMLTGEAV